MKNKFYTSLTILSIFGCTVFTSCEDLLDTKSPSSIEDTDIFSNKSPLKELSTISILITVNRIIAPAIYPIMV